MLKLKLVRLRPVTLLPARFTLVISPDNLSPTLYAKAHFQAGCKVGACHALEAAGCRTNKAMHSRVGYVGCVGCVGCGGCQEGAKHHARHIAKLHSFGWPSSKFRTLLSAFKTNQLADLICTKTAINVLKAIVH